MDGDGLSTDPETQWFTDLYDDKCRLPTISKWHILCWLEGKCLASLKLRPNGGVCSPWFSGSMFFVHEIILGRPGKRSDGTDCPQALVPRQGDLQRLWSWRFLIELFEQLTWQIWIWTKSLHEFTVYHVLPNNGTLFSCFFPEVKATKPILPWMIIIGFQEAKWCCTSQRKSACGYSPASHTCIT